MQSIFMATKGGQQRMIRDHGHLYGAADWASMRLGVVWTTLRMNPFGKTCFRAIQNVSKF